MKIIPPGTQLSSIEKTSWSFEENRLKNQKTYFPRSINLKDIDEAVQKWFKSRDIIINDVVVPVFYIRTEKWAEFRETWKYIDDNKTTVELPYITMRRANSPRLQQSPIKGRIPGKSFTTYKTPYYDKNGGPTYKYYKIPQPIKVDLDYEVHVLTHYTIDINIINEIILKHFASLQAYLDIDKHFMPMTIESVNDETDFDNMEEERILHTSYSITVNGYIIDEKEFEEKIGVSSLLINIDEETI